MPLVIKYYFGHMNAVTSSKRNLEVQFLTARAVYCQYGDECSLPSRPSSDLSPWIGDLTNPHIKYCKGTIFKRENMYLLNVSV